MVIKTIVTHNQTRYYQKKVVYHFSNPVGNILLSKTRTHLLKMIDFPLNEKSLIVDMGCLVGTLTRVISLITETIGLDVDKNAIVWAKKNAKHIDFICADLCHLPFRDNSVDVVVCASVLEYIKKLEDAVKQIKRILKKGGMLIAGYPIETKLLKVIIEIFSRTEVRTWDPLRVMEYKEYKKDPHTHKQKFLAIRDMLNKHFLLLKKEKIPSTYFPDLISIYECAKLIKTKE